MSEFKQALFEKWIEAQGGLILRTTNPYEVLRYKLSGGVHVIYRRANGVLTFAGETHDHYHTFRAGAQFGVRGPSGRRREKVVETLLGRDGDCCVICGEFLNDDVTVEHWLPRAAGGSNDARNLGLAHAACNAAVGDMAVSQKLAVRLASAKQHEEIPPWESADIAAIARTITEHSAAVSSQFGER